MTKKDENDIEQMLLKQKSLDDLIKIKMEEEIKAEFNRKKEKPSKKIIKEIAQVPKDLIFSKQAVYKVFNRTNKVETYINGFQAEAMLGLQNNVRAKIKAGEMDAFSTSNAYVKFEYIEC